MDPSGRVSLKTVANSIKSLAVKVDAATLFWAIQTLYDGLMTYFWGHPS